MVNTPAMAHNDPTILPHTPTGLYMWRWICDVEKKEETNANIVLRIKTISNLTQNKHWQTRKYNRFSECYFWLFGVVVVVCECVFIFLFCYCYWLKQLNDTRNNVIFTNRMQTLHSKKVCCCFRFWKYNWGVKHIHIHSPFKI